MLAALVCLRSRSSPGRAIPSVRTEITRTIGRGRMGVVFEGVADGGSPWRSRSSRPSSRRTRSSCAASSAKSRRPRRSPTRTSYRSWVPGEERGLPYLVQELIPGGSLHDRIVTRGTPGRRDDRPAPDRPRRRDRRAARQRARAPRHQARQHPARRRDRVRDRLRARQGQPGVEPHAARPGARLARLHGAGADPRRGSERRDRRLRARLHDPRVPQRHAAVRRAAEHARAVRAPAGGRRRTSRSRGGDITPAVAKAINRAMEKEPEDRPASASAYIQSIAKAAGSARDGS